MKESESTKRRSSDLLDKLEHNDINSVGTDQLLDMLEQEVMNAELQLITDEPSPTKNGEERRRQLSGYNSGGSEGTSFTSSFLGGLEEDKAIAIQDEIIDGGPRIREVGVAKKKEQLSSSFTTVKSSNGERVTSTTKSENYSDGNVSQSSRRQPFDNPFRSQKHDIRKKDDRSVSGKSTGSKSRGASSAGERSVSFSSKEPHQYDMNQATYPRTVPKMKHEDNSSVDTFSLGSLGSLAVTASTRSSLNSHVTKNTRTSRSSRSSRSSHTSGASTQSSGSARERRQRRELQPVKTSSTKSIGSNTGSFSSLGSGNRRRKKSGGGSKDREIGSASKARNHSDLHTHHPTRYPKRSGPYDQIDEDAEYNQDEAFDELYGGLAASGSDDEGLFRRVEKVKQTIQNSNAGILDSLLESQPLVNTVTDNDDDNQSLGEKSFLSDFLNNRVAQNGTTKQRKGGSSVSKSLMTSDSDDDNNNTFKDKCQKYVNHTDIRSLIKQRALTVLKTVQLWNKDGYLLPTSRIEFIKYGVLALILAPIFHVAITMSIGSSKHHSHSIKSLHASSLRNADSLHHSSGIHTCVMLSSSSSVRENFILVPDTEWVDLPPKPPTRVALPLRIDHGGHPESAMILFTISASKVDNSPSSNKNANTQLWDSIQNDLRPKPLDAWPSWYHNSASRIRDDGFTLMYPSRRRDDAKSALTQLAEEFGQTTFHEFVAWDETLDDNMDIKVVISNLPRLPRKQTDMMIRRTIPTSVKGPGKSLSGEVLVMRRIQDLPIEDDLTLRDFEGPDDVIWNKSKGS